jgi:hypothetical protein
LIFLDEIFEDFFCELGKLLVRSGNGRDRHLESLLES